MLSKNLLDYTYLTWPGVPWLSLIFFPWTKIDLKFFGDLPLYVRIISTKSDKFWRSTSSLNCLCKCWPTTFFGLHCWFNLFYLCQPVFSWFGLQLTRNYIGCSLIYEEHLHQIWCFLKINKWIKWALKVLTSSLLGSTCPFPISKVGCFCFSAERCSILTKLGGLLL